MSQFTDFSQNITFTFESKTFYEASRSMKVKQTIKQTKTVWNKGDAE